MYAWYYNFCRRWYSPSSWRNFTSHRHCRQPRSCNNTRKSKGSRSYNWLDWLFKISNDNEKYTLFTGLCNVLRRFSDFYNNVIATDEAAVNGLTRDIRGTRRGREEGIRQFKTTADATPFLALPRLKGHHTIPTHAYDKQIGCVLLQEQTDGTTRPV